MVLEIFISNKMSTALKVCFTHSIVITGPVHVLDYTLFVEGLERDTIKLKTCKVPNSECNVLGF